MPYVGVRTVLKAAHLVDKAENFVTECATGDRTQRL
jgi:hypothetical protein